MDDVIAFKAVGVMGTGHVGITTWIAPNAAMVGSGIRAIGDNCSPSDGVSFYSCVTVRWAFSGGTKPYEFGPMRIGSDSYIGPLTSTTKRLSIGAGAIVGAHKLVNHAMPAGAKAYGVAAKIFSPQ